MTLAPLCLRAQDPGQEPFRNPELPLEKRVDDLLSRLSVEEKISQTMMASAAIERLGIPRYDWWNEALHGVARNGVATVYPQAIALAATWNTDLHGRIARSIALEARAKNNEEIAKTGGSSKRYAGLTIWSPNINIFRDPRWGRGQETYGEDPLLTARLGVAFVKGLQGDDPKHLMTVATIKHFAVHSGPEPERHHFNAVASERDLRETYLPAFEAGIREGGATSLMSAYNAINGVPAPANTTLLQKILREEWGFSGAVVGDVDNVSDLWRKGTHAICKDAAEASALAIKAGNDLCSGSTYEGLGEALKRGLVTEKDIDVALRRLLSLRFRLGQFDPASRVSFRSIPSSVINCAEHDALALEAARQSIVLLRNDGTLPWDINKLRTVAIVGPVASEHSVIIGNYAGVPAKSVTLAEGLREKLEPRGVKVLAEPGCALVKGFRMSGRPFPEGVLFSDEARTTPGLRGEVFKLSGKDSKKVVIDGAPLGSRTDTQVDLQWDETQPVVGIPIELGAVRWTGVMVPPASGEYILGVVAEGAVRLYIDDKAVIDSWRKDPERPLSKAITLEKGRAYKVRLDYGQFNAKGRVQFGWIAPGSDDSMEKAVAAAKAADHVVLALGITPDLEGESMSVTAEGFTGGDRLGLGLPATQLELLERVSALGKPTVIVLTSGSALAVDETKANAVLEAWYFGQRGAQAVAETLLGENNPSGRLPITFYRDTVGMPAFDDYSMANRTYRYYTGKPLYAFGHGLSYSTFDYSQVTLAPARLAGEGNTRLTVSVKNSGSRTGDEVVQVYATAIRPPVAMPLRQLVGFQRVTLQPGETRNVSIEVSTNQLRRWDDEARRLVVDRGDYTLAVGPASDKASASTVLTIE